MLLEDCFCDRLHRLDNRTRVILISHWKDAGRTSNSGRLLWLLLDNLQVRFRNHPGGDDTLDDLASLPGAALLYPSPGARELYPGGPAPEVLVVVDGTWRQARRLVQRHAALAHLPRVKLPPGPPSSYAARRQSSPERLSTAESVARALGILEGEHLQQAIMEPFHALVRGCLRARGRLPGNRRGAGKISGGA